MLQWLLVSTFADFYLHSTSRSACSAAEAASVTKESKYLTLPPDLIFQPIATELAGDFRETSFLFWRFSVIVQHFNSVLIMDSFCSTDEDLDL